MATPKVDPKIAGTKFSAHEFAWDWKTSQLLARATGCSIRDELDRPSMLKDSDRPGHLMIPFNGALAARNRAEVMDRLIGGYDVWQDVGRWGSGGAKFLGAVPRSGRGRVGCGFTEVGATSKGHALVRFTFEVDDADSGQRLMEGWMLLFLLGCGSEDAGKLNPPRIAMPERAPDQVVEHQTPVNVTFDWAVPSEDWNTHPLRDQGDEPGAAGARAAQHGPGAAGRRAHIHRRQARAGQGDHARQPTGASLPARADADTLLERGRRPRPRTAGRSGGGPHRRRQRRQGGDRSGRAEGGVRKL